MAVTVLHLMPTLMERQLDEAAGWLLKSELERRGQVILTGADTAEIWARMARSRACAEGRARDPRPSW
jgi:nitrite reductase (NADH) large subunit